MRAAAPQVAVWRRVTMRWRPSLRRGQEKRYPIMGADDDPSDGFGERRGVSRSLGPGSRISWVSFLLPPPKSLFLGSQDDEKSGLTATEPPFSALSTRGK
jgi:hypothetical protein